jgi:hypothetical protein
VRRTFDEKNEKFTPVSRSMLGAPHTHKENEDYLKKREVLRKEREKTSFLEALRYKLNEQKYNLNAKNDDL